MPATSRRCSGEAHALPTSSFGRVVRCEPREPRAPNRGCGRCSRAVGLLGLAGAHDASLVGEHDRLDPVSHAELGEYSGHVGLDGGLADDEMIGDFTVGQAAGDEAEDLELAGAQLGQFRRRGMRGASRGELLDEAPR
jgi:hypothetical protein